MGESPIGVRGDVYHYSGIAYSLLGIVPPLPFYSNTLVKSCFTPKHWAGPSKPVPRSSEVAKSEQTRSQPRANRHVRNKVPRGEYERHEAGREERDE